MKREELVSSNEYWLTKIQLDLFNMIETYRKENNLNKTQLAEKLGVTKGYVTQILNGDFDHRVSKLVELAIIFGKVPVLNFIDVEQYKSSAGDISAGNTNKNRYPLKSSVKSTMIANDKIIKKEKGKEKN
ncbi:MAG: helix-turn-helix transcriptional regulator [Saprospiraceae bacterium]|uniref:Helix-turn-helix transcriptional regulator n=1 Tax=Candidatus Opimibacter skivensis TaxID=2982028 RepID=A0A9D7XUW3_9BACT|nr:helix-turn-helix transcriptional regulator [Candidatus Opimibacter skivensis]